MKQCLMCSNVFDDHHNKGRPRNYCGDCVKKRAREATKRCNDKKKQVVSNEIKEMCMQPQVPQ